MQRGIHVSPGIYGREIDMTYAVKSLGITKLGLVGIFAWSNSPSN